MTPLQVTSFLQYREGCGALRSIYELQAVPGWDLPLIRRLIPYIRAGDEGNVMEYGRRGEHSVLWRHTHPPRMPDGYEGSSDKLMFRYRYSLPGHASWGVTAEKDAGEQFFGGAQKKGFDFYSAHLFAAKVKGIYALALGDYVVNIGQGLIQWHSMALGKGSSVMQVKREGEVLRPYTSAGEYYFFRGAGITLKYKRWAVTTFTSYRKLDASADSTGISALLVTGYHRDSAELSKRNRVRLFTAGACLQYHMPDGHVGINVVTHRLSANLLPETTLYGKFAMTGSNIMNASVDYTKGYRNVHLFGELAINSSGQWAGVQGVLASVGPQVDVSLVYRRFARAYTALYPNAFAANSKPVNESGLYMGLSLKPAPRWEVSAYTDLCRFPWLKYRVNAPGTAMDALVLAVWRPSKQVETSWRYTWREQGLNETGMAALPYVGRVRTENLRWHTEMKVGANCTWRARVEVNRRERETATAHGWLAYQECQWRLTGTPFRLGGRVTRFDVQGEGNGLYASENGLLYDYAVSRFSGSGWQWYLNVQYRLSKAVTCWFRIHQTSEQRVRQPLLWQWQVIGRW
ncbi:hypothetical protein MKQ70_21220 [Chitinophaga sedimenti]|uniref:hypothetical protein n=1 Tax=Chitinophaga sedimenti TaxID=2033606 RepID=UPI0020053043|nr:hypothetical protein [Chitinophaga sedimenti]MCK7557384.1 hypothetical protein [Chitinophaga sedimenti]